RHCCFHRTCFLKGEKCYALYSLGISFFLFQEMLMHPIIRFSTSILSAIRHHSSYCEKMECNPVIASIIMWTFDIMYGKGWEKKQTANSNATGREDNTHFLNSAVSSPAHMLSLR